MIKSPPKHWSKPGLIIILKYQYGGNRILKNCEESNCNVEMLRMIIPGRFVSYTSIRHTKMCLCPAGAHGHHQGAAAIDNSAERRILCAGERRGRVSVLEGNPETTCGRTRSVGRGTTGSKEGGRVLAMAWVRVQSKASGGGGGQI